MIGCFFIEQSIVWLAPRHTRREELRKNNVKACKRKLVLNLSRYKVFR